MNKSRKTRKKTRKKRIDVTNKKLLTFVKFIVLLNIFAIPLYAILLTGAQLNELNTFTADSAYALIEASDMQPQRTGELISIPIKDGRWAATIDWDCTAWKSMLAFFALIMSAGLALGYSRRKILAGFIFIPIIYVVNLLRIWFMFAFVKAYDLAYFDIVHTLAWSWGLIIAVLVFWLLWMKYVKN